MFTFPGIDVHDALEWMFTFGWNLRSPMPRNTQFWHRTGERALTEDLAGSGKEATRETRIEAEATAA